MAYSDEVRTAQQVLAANGGDSAKENARQAALIQAADDAGVTRSEYIGYEEAFANYESRPDIEPLVERRAREAGTTAGDADFRRQGEGSAAVFTSPGDGNVGGLGVDTPGDGTDPEATEPDPEVP